MNSKYLSKEILIKDYNVTDVTPDGHVYVNGQLMQEFVQKTNHEFGNDKDYLFVNLKHNTAKKIKYTKTGVHYESRFDHVLVHRACYAWNSESHECKAGLTINHDNENSFDNRFTNLTECSLATNQKLKTKTANQVTNRYDYDTVVSYRAFRKEYNELAYTAKLKYLAIKNWLTICKKELKNEYNPDTRQHLKDCINNLKNELELAKKEYRSCNERKYCTIEQYIKFTE